MYANDKLDSSVTLNGVIENVVYKNADNDYTVLEIVDDENNLVTAVGVIPMAFEGERVLLNGNWVFHKEFGKQFSFDSYEKMLPCEVENIIHYLSSKSVKGIGPVTALKIVNKFGEDTFDVIENHPEWLADIPGITMKKAAVISESFREQSGIRSVMMFFKDYIDKAEVSKVYKKYGAAAISLVKENPYVLCDKELGIPFEKADNIAKSFGVPLDSDERIFAGIEYTLKYQESVGGHTCLPKELLIDEATRLMNIPEQRIENALEIGISAERFDSFLVDGTNYVMRMDVADDERYIALRVYEMEKYINHFSAVDISLMIEKVENHFGIKYATAQKNAIFEALSGSIMVLTGGPGTGKTTVVKGLIEVFKSLGLKCVLAAPTGRAAKRLSETTGEEAKTIHRLLEMERDNSNEIKFNRDAKNPINENVVIVDEASMIDLGLMASLFKALKKGGRMILIGDSDQLPSVGAGNVLSDFMLSGRIPTVCLSEIFRQEKESLIVTNAHKINKGEKPILNDTTKDFFFVKRDDEQSIPQTVADLITVRLPKTYGRQVVGEIQVITPSKKGVGGVAMLNSILQEKINFPSKFKNEVKIRNTIFREGDKVMQTANNYDLEWRKKSQIGVGVFNGDVGVIDSIDSRMEKIAVRFDDRIVEYSFELASDELELAYAITVHKSQGSEYPVVIIPMFSCAPMLMSRNLLYTAVTRAKKMVILVGRSDIPGVMVNNNREILRYTTLRHRIQNFG